MRLIEFKKKFGHNRVIDIRNVSTFFNGFDRRRLFEWQRNGHIIKIVNNYYILPETFVNEDTLKIIASTIYHPSYIGLESALSYYNFIPEAVFQNISLTTRRNKFIQTKMGDFRYRTVKPSLFFGYNAVACEGGAFYISDPEKTLLDVFYFLQGSDKGDVIDSLRLNGDVIRETIDIEKIKIYLKMVASPKIDKAVRLLGEIADVKF